MKRAIKALAFTQVDDYFGEFHPVGKRLKVTTRNTQIVVGNPLRKITFYFFFYRN